MHLLDGKAEVAGAADEGDSLDVYDAILPLGPMEGAALASSHLPLTMT